MEPESGLCDGVMPQPLKILAANRLDETTIIVGFSDGTAAQYSAVQLATLTPERKATEYQHSKNNETK